MKREPPFLCDFTGVFARTVVGAEQTNAERAQAFHRPAPGAPLALILFLLLAAFSAAGALLNWSLT